MKKIVLACALLITLGLSGQITLIPYGATWKYLDNGSNQGTAWRDSLFNDATWASGPAQLGYGDGDEATVIGYGPSSSNKYTTTYFRKTINIANVNSYEEFTFNLYRDDGVIVYVNGKEVYRNNMQPGVSSNTRFAASNCSDDGSTVQSGHLTLAGSNFVSGNNYIAVEIHQCDLTSSDLTFDLQLVAKPAYTGVPVMLFTYGTNWKYLDNGTDQGTAWRAPAFNDGAWASGVSHFGYGDGDEATVVSFGPSSSNKYVTTYFRKNFFIADASAFGSFTFNMYRDDGIIIYVNGTEVYRNNLATNPAYNTAATNASDDGNTVQTSTLTLAASNFVTGNNVIAVEIHQDGITSSDISFDLQLVGTPPAPPAPGGATVTRGPYLQSGTSTGIIIHWKTDNAVDSRVTYGLTQAAMTNTVTVAGATTDHIVTLSGLTPYTKYYYSVGSSTGIHQSGADNYFMTSPIPGTEGKYTFWISGDCGNNSTNQVNCMNRYNTYSANDTTNGWLLLGDNAYNSGTDAEYTSNFFNIYQGSIMKHATLWPAPGNHDYANSGSRQDDHNIPYYSIFDVPANGEAGGVPSGTEAFYSYNYGNIHFLSLDSYGEEGNMRLYDTLGAQVQWIKQDLAANTLPWVVCYWHHPPYTMGSHNSDTEGDLVAMRQNFIRILERSGVDLIICGHSHDYERSKLMKGHYGNEASFNAAAHNLSQSSGKYDGTSNSCAYLKDSLHTLEGTVYIVSGSAGQLGGQQAGYPHNALPYANATNGGSLILTFNGNRLDGKWLCADGVIRDQFTIFKDGSKVTNTTINLGDTLSMSAQWPGDYDWSHSTEATREVEVSPNGTTTYYVTDQYSCIADTFHVNVIIPTIDATLTTLNPLCAGSAFALPFATTGFFRAGNIFTAQLSDASGSFASPVNIGSVAATSSSSINVVIPPATPDGNGYRIRIVASTPGLTGLGEVNPFTVVSAAPATLISDDDADDVICAGDAVSFTASGASTYQFFVNGVPQGPASAVSTFNTAALTNGQQVTVTGINACGSTPSSPVTFTVNPLPVAVLSSSDVDNTICQGTSVTFTAAGGDTYEFFVNNISQGTPAATTTFASSSLVNGDVVKVAATNSCGTDPESIAVTVHALPAAPVAGDEAACFSSSVPSLSASGTNIVWYSDLLLTTQVATGNSFSTGNTASGSYTYYATQTDANGCTGPADAATLVINSLPAAPVAGDEAVCLNASVPSLTASGTNIVWYSNSSLTAQVAGGNSFSTGNTAAGTYTYYLTQTDANGCTGPADNATLTIYALPAAPVGVDADVCFNSAIPSLNASGTNVAWYDNSTLAVQLATGNSFATGNTAVGSYTYYATQTDANGCVSAADDVTLVINALPAAPVTSNESGCFNAAVPSLNATGSNIVWYSDVNLTTQAGTGNTLASGNTAPGSYSYYATQTDGNGCTSAAAQADLVIFALPVAPSTVSGAACANTTIPALNASGASIRWYSDVNLNTQVSSGTTFNTGNTSPGLYTYYATETDVNGCQSTGAVTTLTIHAVPAAPSGGNPTTCEYMSVPSLTVAGSNVIWYSDAGLTTQVATGNAFATGHTLPGVYTYYSTQTSVDGCVSPSAMLTLTIVARPAAPLVTGASTYCEGDVMQTLTASGTAQIWYANAAPSVIIGTGATYFPTTNVSDTVYVTQTQNGCASVPAAVAIVVNPLPVVSVSGLLPQYAVTDPAVTLSGSPAGGTFSGTGVNGNQFDPALAGPGGPFTITYTYTDPVTGCVNSATTDVTVNLATGVAQTVSGNTVSAYPNPADAQAFVHVTLMNDQPVMIELYDLSGQAVMVRDCGTMHSGTNEIVIDRSEYQLAAGVYSLRVQCGDELTEIKIVFN